MIGSSIRETLYNATKLNKVHGKFVINSMYKLYKNEGINRTIFTSFSPVFTYGKIGGNFNDKMGIKGAILHS